MDYILTTDKITKKFSKVTAVDAVSIHVARGEVYGLIGRNGAGKTTLLKMLGTLSFPTEGSFTITGVNGESTKAMMPRVGVLIEDPGIYQNLSAFQNLKAKALAFGMKDDNYLRQLLVLVGLGGVEKKPVKNFSLGMKQRLGIALAMVNSPELLLLDEPINGLDPQGIAEIRTLIRRLCTERKITIIVSSHILDELSKIADRYGIIHHGKLIDEATNEDLLQRCKAYAVFRTSDVEKTKQILASLGITDYTFTGEHFEIRERVEEMGAISMALAKSDVQTLEMRKEGQSLEEYYFQLTGGEPNA
ncbi:MAG: ATP-binding cassette domain-containing protein [Lachnospiraceae bacterium]|nr:ATP-binding cassette domain-containing protein [Clostridiales bacterium]MBR6850661.1 ATP-binding cassette domain-containing protein [Lachnospiraceae bacterium]